LRELVRSSLICPYSAPHSASASAPIICWANIATIARNMSGLAEARFSSSSPENGRLSTAVIVLISPSRAWSFSKNQPVAASHSGTTPATRDSITPL
jgi:hypothetical protein